MIRVRPAFALLEVVVALAILGVAAIELTAVARESLTAAATATDRERDFRAANEFMSAVALWSSDDLDRHLGRRPEGQWTMYVERVTPVVYSVSLADSSGQPLFETYLYRRGRYERSDAR
jgi:prepilin-type N-terminal cleavage/methylation domain-containing protein